MEIGDNTGSVPKDATIVGNTCLYGARGDQVFVSGKAGERFAVQNYLGHTVVEGTRDNCCDCMTGGCLVVPGKYNLLFLISRRIVSLY
jgi:glutamate synthase domain-containing protein 3